MEVIYECLVTTNIYKRSRHMLYTNKIINNITPIIYNNI